MLQISEKVLMILSLDLLSCIIYRDFQMNWYCLLTFQFIQTVPAHNVFKIVIVLCVFLKQGLFDILDILMIPD